MFGLLQPCGHVLDAELRDEWRSHMCGVCLSLRDHHGQLSRAATNTDTIMVSVLTASQRDTAAATRRAGPCPLRGMRTATVVRSDEPGITLAGAASLALAAAKADDVVAEQQYGLAAAEPRKGRAAAVASRSLHRRMKSVTDLDVETVLGPLSTQAELECTDTDLDRLLEPTAAACAAVFASSADRAGAPQNRTTLAEMGADFGRLAHLLDAVDDRAADRSAGAFNPLDATGTTDQDALGRAETLAANIAERYEQLVLHDDRLLKALLVGGVARAVRARRRSLARGMTGCADASTHYREGWPATPPPDHSPGAPWPPPFKPNRRWHERILPLAGVSCCGPALCMDHWNHCSDKHYGPACNDCGSCDCGPCDCCD